MLARFAHLEPEDRLRLMKFVCSFAWADLRVADLERQFVHRMVRKLELRDDEAQLVEGWLELPPTPEEVDPAEIPAEHRQLFLEVARDVVLADGELSREERENLVLLQELLRG
jgi:uncharacterized tellurite resistance protein B-like protein